MEKDSFPEAESSSSSKIESSIPDLAASPVQNKSGNTWVKPLLIGTGLGIAIAFGGTRLMGSRPAASTPAAANQVAADTPASMTVTLTPAETQSVTRTLSVTGSIAASNLTPVLPQANGLQIKEVRVNVGDAVKKGDILAILDNSLIQDQLRQAQAEVESQRADITAKKADLLSRQAGVESSLSQVKVSQANLGQAKARLLEAERSFKRNRDLANNGAVSRQVLDNAETNLLAAREAVSQAQANIRSTQASVSTAQANVQGARADIANSEANLRSAIARVAQIETQRDQTVVRAPVSGVIAEKLARVGDVTGVPPQTQVNTVIGGSQKLFSIVQDGRIELQALVPEVQLAQIRVGASATVTSDSAPSLSLQGNVTEIEPVIDQQRREATVKISLPASRLRPGMFGRARINTTSALGTVIPQKALQTQPDGSNVVYQVSTENTRRENNFQIAKVVAQKVETGEIINDKIEIKTGLKPGDKVVLEGAGYVKDGDNVRIKE